MTTTFHQHTIKSVTNTAYSQYMTVSCQACLTDKNGHTETYSIEYHRSPITGELRGVTCLPKNEEDTTPDTLTPEAVQDICWGELQG